MNSWAQDDLLLFYIQEKAEMERETVLYLPQENMTDGRREWLKLMGFRVRDLGLQTVSVSWAHATETPYRHRSGHSQLFIECAFDALRLSRAKESSAAVVNDA